MTEAFVIVGASHASVQAIDTLRREGHQGPIVLVGDEPHLPYNRPPLSKKFLSGELERERLLLRSPQFYEQARVEARLGVRVTAIDRGARRLRLGDGGELSYDKLLLCVGSRPRLLERTRPRPRAASTTCARSRTSRPSAPTSERARRLVVVGAGYIGLEAAASARHLGLDVTVLEMADRPLNRVVAPELSDFYLRRHEREGVRIHCGTSVTAFEGDGRVRAVVCGDRDLPRGPRDRGRRHPAGREPRGRGRHPLRERRLGGRAMPDLGRERLGRGRLHQPSERPLRPPRAPGVGGQRGRAGPGRGDEHVRQAGAARARALVLVRPVRRQAADRGPVAGLRRRPCCAATRGRGSFALYYLAQGELLAVDAVNSPRDFMTGKRWIAERKHPDPAKLADASCDLKTL